LSTQRKPRPPACKAAWQAPSLNGWDDAWHSPGSLLPVCYKGNVVIKDRFPDREAVARKVSVGDRTTGILLTPDGK
jgi:hypothetical protein